MKKTVLMLLIITLAAAMLAGCLNSAPPAPYSAPPAGASAAPAAPGNNADVVTSASPKESGVGDDLINGLKADGYWIFSILNDITLTTDLHIDGDFHSRDDQAQPLYRKLSLYAQDSDRNVTAEYLLAVPNVYVTSTNMRIQCGLVRGNIFVDAMGFELYDAVLEGDLTFATREQMDSAKLGRGTINGTVFVGNADAVTAASPKESASPVSITHALSDDGFWIFAALDDITLTEELVVGGTFHRRGDPTQDIYRKLALYAQNAERQVTAEYTLTVPKMTVESPGFSVQIGTVKGDIYVNADDFELTATLEGNLTFATQAQMDSAKLDDATITGTVSVG